MSIRKKDREGLFKSIFTAYFILLLHVFLLAGVGLTVVLFKGVYHYLPWILGGIGVLLVGLVLLIYRRMRESTSNIQSILGAPEFQDRAVEVRLLGGLASFKIKPKEQHSMLLEQHGANSHLIETSVARAERKMLELNTLYEKSLITRQEFDEARQKIIQG